MQDSFRAGLEQLGWREGREVVMEVRFADGDIARMDALMSSLVAWRPDLIYTPTTAAAQAARRATRSIPIVFATASDPVGSGLVKSLARPGGNATGLSSIGVELTAKRLQVLREAVPGLSRLAVLSDPTYRLGQEFLDRLRQASIMSNVLLNVWDVSNATDIDQAFKRLSQSLPDGLFVIDNSLNYRHRQMITARANAASIPAVYPVSEYAVEGGLMSYGANYSALSRRAAGIADKVLRGVKPDEIPVAQPNEFELIINLRTAKALRIALPQSLVLRAQQLIE